MFALWKLIWWITQEDEQMLLNVFSVWDVLKNVPKMPCIYDMKGEINELQKTNLNIDPTPNCY